MSISKISRSLFVALFLILIIFMGYQDVRLLLSNTSSNVTLNILKVVYIIVAVILVLLYVYICPDVSQNTLYPCIFATLQTLNRFSYYVHKE